MNYYDFSLLIKTSSKEEREHIFEEVRNKPIGDKYYCRYYCCERDGECNIRFCVNMRGGITDDVYELLDLPQKYPNVSVEKWFYNEWYLSSHEIIHKDSWESIWTTDDIIQELGFYSEFSLKMLELLETFRKVYNYDGSLISEEIEKVPFPIDEVSDAIREGYEEWKKNPIEWEEKKRIETDNRVFEFTGTMDDLPF